MVTMAGDSNESPRATSTRDALALSVVVVVFNIPREAPRTLLSLSAAYQRGVRADDYEVIVVDNGSNPPVAEHDIESFGQNFRLIRMESALPSPLAAVNRGLAEARGELIGVHIDARFYLNIPEDVRPPFPPALEAVATSSVAGGRRWHGNKSQSIATSRD